MAKLEVHKWRYCIDIVLIPQLKRLFECRCIVGQAGTGSGLLRGKRSLLHTP